MDRVQSQALNMLFSAHHDQDQLRIQAAMEHLEFLDAISGLTGYRAQPQFPQTQEDMK